MLRKMLHGKIHRATVTQCDPDYVGSITVDERLLRASGIVPNEAVWVLDIDNAARFETYVIRGKAGSGIVGINGAAAKLVEPGHKVIILAYAMLTEAELERHEATVVITDDRNQPVEELRYPSALPEPVLV